MSPSSRTSAFSSLALVAPFLAAFAIQFACGEDLVLPTNTGTNSNSTTAGGSESEDESDSEVDSHSEEMESSSASASSTGTSTSLTSSSLTDTTTAETSQSMTSDDSQGSTTSSSSDSVSDSSSSSESSSDSGTTTSSELACGTVELGGEKIYESAGPNSYPIPAGGPIADGLYHLAAHSIYPPGSVDPYWRQRTLKIAGNTFEGFEADHTGKIGPRYSGSYSTLGSSLTRNVTCPLNANVTQAYTATASRLFVFDLDNKEVYTYTRDGASLECTNQAQLGGDVLEVANAGAMPLASGGALVNGTYVLSSIDVYNGALLESQVQRETVVIEGSALHSIVKLPDSGSDEKRSGTMVNLGTALNLNFDCPLLSSLALGYSTTADGFLVIVGDRVRTYTRKN